MLSIDVFQDQDEESNGRMVIQSTRGVSMNNISIGGAIVTVVLIIIAFNILF